MAVTPKGIVTPDSSSPYNLITDLNTLASTTDTAITNASNLSKGTAAQRAAFTSTATNGVLWQDTDDIKMIWRKDGAAWVPAVWRWSGTTAQMNGFTQAPNGFEWFSTTDNSDYVRSGGAWKRGDNVLRGRVARQTVAGNDVVPVTITFPAGIFDAPPIVVAGIDSSARDTSVTVDLVTTTSASIRLGVNGTSARQVGATWIAYPAS